MGKKLRLIIRVTHTCPSGEVTSHNYETREVEVEDWPTTGTYTDACVVGAEELKAAGGEG